MDTSIESEQSERNPRTYSIRGLIIATAFVAMAAAWLVDRVKIRELRFHVAQAEKLEDMLERNFMTDAVVGRPVLDHPNLQLLVDAIIVPSDEHFRTVLDRVSYPEVLGKCDNCEIYWFDLASSGVEGDPFDFYLLVSDGVITRMRRGESSVW